jgi:D-methionine transport system substrate-binding protein
MRSLVIAFVLIGLVSCNKPTNNQLIVGAIAGPEADLLHTAAEVADKQSGLKIKIVEFNDYTLPNVALQNKSIDVNIFQHLPYLKAASQDRGYDFVVIGKTFLFPMRLYSKKVQSLDQLPVGALIAVPNDPSNETRALLLLQKAGLITLKNKEIFSSDQNAISPLNNIISNPKALKIKEIDAAQLPRALEDVDAAVINSNFAKLADLRPARDAIFMETKDSHYAELIVVRRNSLKQPQINALIKALHSREVQQKAVTLFADEAIRAW